MFFLSNCKTKSPATSCAGGHEWGGEVNYKPLFTARGHLLANYANLSLINEQKLNLEVCSKLLFYVLISLNILEMELEKR